MKTVKNNYITGFEKIARARGYDPEKLAQSFLLTKLRKQASVGVIANAAKVLPRGIQLASKGYRALKSTGRLIGNGVRLAGKEFATNIRRPEALATAGATVAGTGISHSLKDTAVVKKLKNLNPYADKMTGQTVTNNVPSSVMIGQNRRP